MVERKESLESFHLKLPSETLLRVREHSEESGVSYTEWIRDAIERKLRRAK